MSMALENRVAELEAAHIKLINDMEELNKRLQHIEERKKPGPKPKDNGHMQPQDMQ